MSGTSKAASLMFAIAAVAGGSACFFSINDVREPAPSDAGASDTSVFDVSPIPDAPPCRQPVLPNEELLAPLDATRWSLERDAVARGDGVALTAGIVDTRGALWRSDVFVFDALEVEAEVSIQGGTQAGDGLAFVWVRGEGAPKMGTGAAGVGAYGADGFAVVLDVYRNTFDTTEIPMVAVADPKEPFGAGWYRTTAPVGGPIADGAPHRFKVTLEVPRVSVSVDGKLLIDRFELPGFSAYRGKWGFTAASGQVTATHLIRRVTARIPDGRGCL